MKITQVLRGKYRAWRQRAAQRRLLARLGTDATEITPADWDESLRDPSGFYVRCFHYFHARLPQTIRDHRNYFEQHGRGFGEKAFHTMWFLLFREFKPDSFLEIGVFRGQTLSLAALLARHFGSTCFIQGISPFSPAGDAVSKYRRNVDYQKDTLANFAHFNLPAPALLKAFSTDETARRLVSSRPWSLVYIDGNHDYEVARADWELCSAHLQPNGIIVLDDSALATEFVPPVFATAGHPGPSRLAGEIDRTHFREILRVGHNRVFRKNAP